MGDTIRIKTATLEDAIDVIDSTITTIIDEEDSIREDVYLELVANLDAVQTMLTNSRREGENPSS